ncbi:alpha-d-phosphohexomutase alpha/beta/alpha i/ii/iii [Trichococcus palustris]|jgi:phosphomannomutase|uniref:Alpha-d-phosphohexomutase alpha/beta/alpha i/ii/iii n=1 Tax=Trichococcus palustris TaxID=140314 RepID=A0A143YMF8_9LACT|nr:phosphomannomutase/phosphoglucomutase [Trichococcus palustris]CZQ91926.1 alpha-d-phosphohexomutase alpha/beta/alpha i/ii/iii [Trichococcus palustris]SFL04553.1 Phosphomannomutase [Trichococcus palustris]
MTDKKALLALQNGSDIRGIAITTEKHEANLTADKVTHIGYGFGQWLSQTKGIEIEAGKKVKVAIGHDSRLSAAEIKAALIKGLAPYPVEIIDVGLATTPAMFMSTQYEDYLTDAAVMITASHLPFEYNGLKFFTKTGGAEHEDIEALLTFAGEMPESFTDSEVQAVVTEKDLLTVYATDLQDKIRKGIASTANAEKPLTGRHIIVDAGNGAGGFFVEKVLQPLGANTEGSQFLDPDGTFPNHVPNPDNKAAMQSIQDAVIAQKADLGIIFDTDVDRSAIVDKDGKAFNRNNLIALIAAVLLADNPGATIVTNSATSSHLETFITGLGGVQDRYLTGYRNVINRGIDLNNQGINAVLAIETSGHAALKENYFLDDGAYLIAKLLIADAKLSSEGKHLGDLIADLGQPAETTEYRFTIVQEPIFETGNQIIKEFADFVKATEGFGLVPDHLEGVRVNLGGKYGEGWFILRLSLHEPLLVWTIESDETGKLPIIADAVLPFFKARTELDTTNM